MSLSDRLKEQIRQNGPMTVAQYMTACLHDPEGGYYAARPRLGADGDFITAPMVSQMFGELIGLWCAEVWDRLGRPARVSWIEVGPGDGGLMEDALRAVRAAPGFLAAARLFLLEPSAPLRTVQREHLRPAAVWIDSLSELPTDAPIIVVANEVLDCMPARQFIRTENGWAERLVGLDNDGDLAFGLTPSPRSRGEGGARSRSEGEGEGQPGGGETPSPHPLLPGGRGLEAEIGTVLEISPAQEAFGAEIGRLVARQGGAALLIDYGRAGPEFGDTLQALRGHQKIDPLATPGEADLTVHADFPAVLAAARAEGAATSPILSQAEFLTRLGVKARAAALTRARPDKAEVIARQLHRLIAPDQMGVLFKAACIHSAGVAPPGFEAAP